jgi:hypothetical protein
MDELVAAAPFAVFAPEAVPASWSCRVWFNGDVAALSYHDESQNGETQLSVLLAPRDRQPRFGSPEAGPPWREVTQERVTYRQRGPAEQWPSSDFAGRWSELYYEAGDTTIGLGSNKLDPEALLTLAQTMRRIGG